MKSIAVIGAGLSGTLLTMNLLRLKTREPLLVKWIDRNDASGLGPAYSTNEDYLLNVPVELMGAYADEPEHFLYWLEDHWAKVEKGAFLPRKIYRQYIQSVFSDAFGGKPENIVLERIQDEVIGMESVNLHLRITTSNSGVFETDKAVLAIGNALPEPPRLNDTSFISNRCYTPNPWDPSILSNIHKDDNIVFIGTGQTMVDLLTGLKRRKHRGMLTGISRRGVLPLSHKSQAPYPSFYEDLRDLSDILTLFKIIRGHIKKAREAGNDARDVIDSLRPHTIAIWMNLPIEEKKRFLKHLFRYWEVVRSRIPPESDWIIKELLASGQLRILAGTISEITPDKDGLQILYRERFSHAEKRAGAHYVINCKGPCLDYNKIDQPLIRNLIQGRLIHCDPAHLGIDALPEGNVMQTDGTPSQQLYAIGPLLKGIVWESIATPEIRVQAERLAGRLMRE